MAEDATGNDETVKVGKGDKKPGKGGFVKKYKWWILGGGAALVLIIVLYMRSNAGASAAAAQPDASTNGTAAIDPATGYEEGTPADIAALGGSGSQSGLPGPAGATGATGATGTAGKPSQKGTIAGPSTAPDAWSIATSILEGRGVKNPSHAQIHAVWAQLEKIGTKRSPKPVTHKPPQKRSPNPKMHPGVA